MRNQIFKIFCFICNVYMLIYWPWSIYEARFQIQRQDTKIWKIYENRIWKQHRSVHKIICPYYRSQRMVSLLGCKSETISKRVTFSYPFFLLIFLFCGLQQKIIAPLVFCCCITPEVDNKSFSFLIYMVFFMLNHWLSKLQIKGIFLEKKNAK